MKELVCWGRTSDKVLTFKIKKYNLINRYRTNRCINKYVPKSCFYRDICQYFYLYGEDYNQVTARFWLFFSYGDITL